MKIFYIIIIGSILLFSFICIFIVFSPEKEKNISENNNEKNSFILRHGEKLYSHYCSPCHGIDGKGEGIYFGYGLEPKPANFTDPDFFQNRSETDIKTVIEKGSRYIGKSNLCPPWEGTFVEEEIVSIMKFIKFLSDTGRAETK